VRWSHVIEEPFDAVIGIGMDCQSAYQLHRMKLRSTAGPLDEMLSPNASIADLFRRRFSDFMSPERRLVDGMTTTCANCHHVSEKIRDDGDDFICERCGERSQVHHATAAINREYLIIRDALSGCVSPHTIRVPPESQWQQTLDEFSATIRRRSQRLMTAVEEIPRLLLVRKTMDRDTTEKLYSAIQSLTSNQVV